MNVIQLIEEFYKHADAVQALQDTSEMPGFLGGSVLLPLLSEFKYKIRAFFEADSDEKFYSAVEFPEGIKLVYVPERLLAWYGIEVPE